MSNCPETCGTCEHHKRTEKNFTCFNKKSDFYGADTPYYLDCEEWEERKKWAAEKEMT